MEGAVRGRLATVVTATAAVVVLIGVGVGVGALVWSGKSTPRAASVTSKNPARLLYVVDGSLASVEVRPDGQVVLHLSDVDDTAVEFAEAPTAYAQPIPSSDLFAKWAKPEGCFAKRPPNAAISAPNAGPADRTTIGALTNPAYDPAGRTVSIEVTPMNERSQESVTRLAESSAPGGPVALFIDDCSTHLPGNYDDNFAIVWHVGRVPIDVYVRPIGRYQCVDDSQDLSLKFRTIGLQPVNYVHLTIKTSGDCSFLSSYQFWQVRDVGRDQVVGEVSLDQGLGGKPLIANCGPFNDPRFSCTSNGSRQLNITIK